KLFGTANLAMLFGIVMLAHQIGGFFGAYLGGYVFQVTGSYDWVWSVDLVLAAGAALVHLPIREKPVPRAAAGA
ncbi:MAG: MFS transporter, partial [Comamonadaceae bacterium]